MAVPTHIFIRTLQIAVFVATVPACATLKKAQLLPRRKPHVSAARTEVPRPIGTIALVNEDEHFVLIDTGMAASPPVGTALKSFTGEFGSGVVAVGNVNRRPFIVADIVHGAPKKGDTVFQ